MPTTSEVAFNVNLANVLQTKHPRWRDRVSAEQRNVFRETSLQPDIIVRPIGGLPIILETEFTPARSVETDAKDRLGEILQDNGVLIEQVLAIQIPRELQRVSQGNLERHIKAAEFRYCSFSLQGPDSFVRWPSKGWIVGSVEDLATCIENISLSERLIANGIQILEHSIGEAAGKLRETSGVRTLRKMAQSLYQEDSEQTSRMAMAIITNALVFHTAIVNAHDIPTIDELRTQGSNDVSKNRLLKCWQHIIDKINYDPIFRIASNLLLPIADSTANAILNCLARATSDLSGLGATTFHDLSGRMFQRLIADRKFLATFYTLPTSAALLSELAVSRLDDMTDWSNPNAVTRLRVADLACGTGTLISAAYRALSMRHRRSGGDDQALHTRMMEQVLIAADIMPAAMHLTASMLSSTHPGITFSDIKVHTLPYGQQSEETRHTMALGALDFIEEDIAPSLFSTGIQIMRGTGTDVELKGSHDMVLPHKTADLVIMNPPFTRPTNHKKASVPVPSFAGLNTSTDEQRKMSRRLNEIRIRLKNTGYLPNLLASHGNAGLASNFIDLAHAKIKRGGVFAFVLPLTFTSGESWQNARRLIETEYENITLLTITATKAIDASFSADTNMAEVLVIATKCHAEGEGIGETLFVNLNYRPSSLVEAFETARAISHISLQDRQGKLRVGDQEITGTYIRASLNQGGCASFRELSLANTAMGLMDRVLRLPRGYSISFPTTSLGDIGKTGLLHRDISGKTSGSFALVIANA